MVTLTSCLRTWVGILTGDCDKWVVRISMIIDWIRNAFKMRVGVHGLKYMELLNEFFASIVLVLILDGFLIFEYTDLSILITYEIDGDGVDGYDLDNALWRFVEVLDHSKH